MHFPASVRPPAFSGSVTGSSPGGWRGESGTAPSQRFVADLARAHADRAFERGDENLAVADLAGARRSADRLDGVVGAFVADRDIQAQLRQEGDLIFRAAINFRPALLPAITGHLADRHAVNRRAFERRPHF